MGECANNQQLPPGPELDAKVAEALGWKVERNIHSSDYWYEDTDKPIFHNYPPPFSTDGNWMLKALDWLREETEFQGISRDLGDGWGVELIVHTRYPLATVEEGVIETAETLPHAIALAVVEAAERMGKNGDL